MYLFKFSFVVLAIATICNSVKVDMQGSLSIGQEVLDTLTHYMSNHNFMPFRRSLSFSKDDILYLTVKTTYLCQDLIFCEGELETFINEYITLLTKSIQAICESSGQNYNKTFQRFFDEELRRILREIRKLLRTTNTRATAKNDTYFWSDVVKKIAAQFQESAINFAADKLDEYFGDTAKMKKQLRQKFVIATVLVEQKFEKRLCSEYSICITSNECTKALSTLLAGLQSMESEKVKMFMHYVAEGLLDTKFYSHLSEGTASELQVILNDMAYSESVPTKEVLLLIQKTVDERLNAGKLNNHVTKGKDVALMHMILSDMDHFYAKRRLDPFHSFLKDFFDWSRLDKKLMGSVRRVLKEIGEDLHGVSESLHLKLINEVREFLELTVDHPPGN